MFFNAYLQRLLTSVFLVFCFIFTVLAQEAQVTPFQELAQKLAMATTDAERMRLIEQNKPLQTPDLRKALVQQGLRLRGDGSYEQALALDRFTKQFAEMIGDRIGVAASFNNIGLSYQETGQYQTSIENFKQGIKINTELNNQLGLASANNNIGLSYIYMGEYRLAEGYLQQSAKFIEALNRRDLLPNPLNNLGIIQRRLGNRERAQDYYEQSLKICEETKNKLCASQALSNLGILKNEAGDYANALDLHRKGLALREEINNKKGISISLNNIGSVYTAQGDFSAAVETFEKSLKIVGESKIEDSEATSLLGIAFVKIKLRRFTEALEYAERAARIAKKIGNEELLWEINEISGIAYRLSNQPQKAREALEAAIKVIESRRLQLTNSRDAQNYFSNKIEPYHEALKLVIESGENKFGALNYAERAKARVLLDVLASAASDSGKSMSEDERLRENEINARISVLNAQILRERARAPSPDPERLKQLEDELDQAHLAYDNFKGKLYTTHPELQTQRGEAKIITPEGIAGLLNKNTGTALLEYTVTKDAVYCFAITSPKRKTSALLPEINVYTIPISQIDLGVKINNFRQAIATRDEYEKISRELYEVLLTPVRRELAENQTLIIVPDGALWNLPFQALLNHQNRFLLEDFTVSYAPSLTALSVMRKTIQNQAARSQNGQTLLAFGNPQITFDNSDTRLDSAKSRNEADFAPLPDAEREVNLLANLYGAKNSKIYVKTEAREDRAKNESSGFKIVHFATHGIFNDTSPLYSYLLLAPGRGVNGAAGDDGFLEARELLNLNLSADLVILSACETARGRISEGEGLTGMTWALFIAGVPTTVASQWKIPSASTAEIMLGFHRNLLKTRGLKTKAEALRAAELNYLHTGQFRHPFYWAGFVLIGVN